MDSREATKDHIRTVDYLLHTVADLLKERAHNHDKSKLEEPELSIFDEYTPKLKGSTYGSEEYNTFLKEMKVALDHHYADNRHHPEHFEKGVDEMNLIDLVEMFCDWTAAVRRHDDGDIDNSIKINTKRFKLSPQLVSILRNTEEIIK